MNFASGRIHRWYFPSCKKKYPVTCDPGKGQLCKSFCVRLRRLVCNSVEEMPSAEETWGLQGKWTFEGKILHSAFCISVFRQRFPIEGSLPSALWRIDNSAHGTMGKRFKGILLQLNIWRRTWHPALSYWAILADPDIDSYCTAQC